MTLIMKCVTLFILLPPVFSFFILTKYWYIVATYVIMDFSSGRGTSTSVYIHKTLASHKKHLQINAFTLSFVKIYKDV